MTNFIMGVISSIVAVFILSMFRGFFIKYFSLLFYKIYPNISVKWIIEWEVIKNETENEQNQSQENTEPSKKKVVKRPKKGESVFKDIIEISQFGNKISGLNQTYEDDKVVSEDKIIGKVTPSRVVLFTYESITSDHHDFGSALLKLTPDSKFIVGYLTFLCIKCEKSSAKRIRLRKIG